MAKQIQLAIGLWDFATDGVKENLFKTYKYNAAIIKAQIQYWKNTFYVNLVALKLLFKHKEYDPKNALKAQPYCYLTIPNCSAGTELTHSFYKEKGWDTSYGWHCRKCPDYFYRNKNQAFCHPCKDGEISDKSRTFCFDPFF